jgi:hypothetical protein
MFENVQAATGGVLGVTVEQSLLYNVPSHGPTDCDDDKTYCDNPCCER